MYFGDQEYCIDYQWRLEWAISLFSQFVLKVVVLILVSAEFVAVALVVSAVVVMVWVKIRWAYDWNSTNSFPLWEKQLMIHMTLSLFDT